VSSTSRSSRPPAAACSALRDWLAGHGVTQVVMEATGVYWKAPVRHEALFGRVG
jgi:hypothetical protein